MKERILLIVFLLVFLLPFSVRADIEFNCTAWEDYDDKFYSCNMEFVAGKWLAPEYYRLFWNNATKSLDAPLLENQIIESFDFNITTTASTSIWVIIYGMDFYSPDYYSGDGFSNIQGFGTNGIVIATTYWNTTNLLNCHFNINHWNRTGWYKLCVHIVDSNQIRNTYAFYMNTSCQETEPNPSSHVQIPISFKLRETIEMISPPIKELEKI